MNDAENIESGIRSKPIERFKNKKVKASGDVSLVAKETDFGQFFMPFLPQQLEKAKNTQ